MKKKGAERIDRDAQKREAERLAREREAIGEISAPLRKASAEKKTGRDGKKE